MTRNITGFLDNFLNAAILWSFVFVQAMSMPRVNEAFGAILNAVEAIGGTPVRY